MKVRMGWKLLAKWRNSFRVASLESVLHAWVL
jgi:hypothetical protein